MKPNREVKGNSINISDLERIWTIVRKNWWILLIFLVLSYVAAKVYTYKQPIVYASGLQVLLKSNDQLNTGSIISDNYGGFYGGGYKTYIDNSNEMRVLRSYDLIAKAVERLDFDVSYSIVGRIRTQEVYSGVPFEFKYASINNNLYEVPIKFRILNYDEYELRYPKPGGTEETALKGRFGKELVDVDMKVTVNRSGNFAKGAEEGLKKIEYLVHIHQRSLIVAKYQSALQVMNPEYTNILQLSINDEIPERSARFLDTLAQVYIENSLLSRIEVNKNTLFFIEKQMEEVTDILNNIEDTMQHYKEEKAILELNKEGDKYFQQLADYESKQNTLELELGSMADLEHYIIENKDPEFLPPSIYVITGDGFLQRTTSELYSMQINLNQARVSATKDNFAIKQYEQKIEALKKNLLTYIGNRRTATYEQIKDVQEKIDEYIGRIKELPLKQRGLLNIQRKQKVNEDMYIFLLQKKANTIIARAGIIPETRIIESARPLNIVSPDEKKILYTFVGIGAVIALLIIAVRVLFFQRIESYEQLKAATHLPIVGEVIYSPTVADLLIAVENEPKSPLTESFRTIRTNLQYMAAKPGGQVVVITSNGPGEGKTFCSINLAAILAKAGKRVILLELDLHKPRVQKGLGLEADVGISTIVIGKTSIVESVKPTQVENLDVILSGPLPPNPSEMMLTQAMSDIIEYGRQHYEYVIVDTPPVGLISDAIVLMKSADINLFVLNTRFAYRDAINNAHEIVALNEYKNFGFILNGVKRKRSKYYYNRYGYGYGYGSRYGSGYGGGYGGYGSYGSYGGYGERSGKKKKK